MTTPDSTPIADRVRFWEEQDKINQELIPRVIRQHELMSAHIADHENLPLETRTETPYWEEGFGQ